MGTTTISWTDKTWNPIRGCSRISEGCRNCYAERMAARFSKAGFPYEGLATMTPEGPRWTGKVRLVEEHLGDPLKWRKPARIFVNSMSDMFHESLPDEVIDRIYATMILSPQHTYQILTKRPERALNYFRGNPYDRILRQADKIRMRRKVSWVGVSDPNISPPKNVWLGTSVEDQETANKRIPYLLDIPAAVHFISAEPLLGPINLTQYMAVKYNPIHEKKQRGISIQDNPERGLASRQKGARVENSEKRLGPLEKQNCQPSLPSGASRARHGGIPDGARDGKRGPRIHSGIETSMESIKGTDSGWHGHQPQEREEEGQSSREFRGNKSVGEHQTQSVHSKEKSARIESVRGIESCREIECKSGPPNPEAESPGGIVDEHSEGLRSEIPAYLASIAWRPLGASDLVIVGGESGPGARPCSLAWIDSIVSQCRGENVPVFVKQLGSKPFDWVMAGDAGVGIKRTKDPKGGDMSEWPHELRVREFPR